LRVDNDDWLRFLARGIEAAPNAQTEKTGQNNVAAGRNILLFAVLDDSNQVDCPCQPVKDIYRDAQRIAKILVIVMVCAGTA
jgi:hypothetical protein